MDDNVGIVILLLAAAALLKIAWPIIEGIFKSFLELLKVVLTVVIIGGGILLIGNMF